MEGVPVVRPVAVLALDVGQLGHRGILLQDAGPEALIAMRRDLPAPGLHGLIPSAVVHPGVVADVVALGACLPPVPGRVVDVLGEDLGMSGVLPGGEHVGSGLAVVARSAVGGQRPALVVLAGDGTRPGARIDFNLDPALILGQNIFTHDIRNEMRVPIRGINHSRLGPVGSNDRPVI
jgi:hypothetical protein